MMSLASAPGIIPALDLDLPAAERLVASLDPVRKSITGLKIGSLLVMEHGLPEVCKRLETDIPLVLDMQKHGTDIPDIVRRQVETAARFGVAAYIASPLGAGASSSEGRLGTLEAFVSACKGAEIIPIVVLEMTQPGATRFIRSEGLEELAQLVCDLEVSYVVAPATRPERLARYRDIFAERRSGVEIVSPGVGPQKTGDPVCDATEAIKHGADHLVVGRAVYGSPDPSAVVAQIAEAAAQAFSTR